MKPETRFSSRVQKKLKEHGAFVIRTQAGSIGGIPDLIICRNGVFFAWELKVGKNTTTKLQEVVLNRILLAGGHARVVTPETLNTAVLELLSLSEKDFHERNETPKKESKR